MIVLGASNGAAAQDGVPLISAQKTPSPPASAEELYLKLKSVGLDSSRVYRIRDVTLDRAAVHLTLDDGTIAFTEDVAGHVSGAFFDGEGEVLLSPPDRTERASMALFTGGAILEESFTSAYLRFNDNTYGELQPYLNPVDGGADFVLRWNELSRTFAEADGLRLLLTYSRDLPVSELTEKPTGASDSEGSGDQMLHAQVQGRKLGLFDVGFDSESPEQVWAGQSRTREGVDYYDLWVSFSVRNASIRKSDSAGVTRHGPFEAVRVADYKIRAKITPPTLLEAETRMHLEVRRGGQRALLFEFSRSLQVSAVEADGRPVEFIHNPSLEGTERARRGNDLVAVILPQPSRIGQILDLRFAYAGDVLSQAGPGLLYVGSRGTWYPSAGLAMAKFDLQFEYPPGWTLVATGKQSSPQDETAERGRFEKRAGDRVGRWISERPIPVAGFNLGKYQRATAQAGNVTVEAYATSVVEGNIRQKPDELIVPGTSPATAEPGAAETLRERLSTVGTVPSPARNAQSVADAAADALDFFSRHFGPYPSGTLMLTQMPGKESQGWPGLIYLSSLAFLTREELARLPGTDVDRLIVRKLVTAHETAHQWWGQLVDSAGYRDQWWVEALANYSALMFLQSKDPAQFHLIMEKYRDDLLQKSKSRLLLEDGPVALGTRLSNSEFPSGYMAISYGRGTWLFHMLRYMLLDAEKAQGVPPAQTSEEPFLRVLRKLRDRYQGKSITTQQLMETFAEELPLSLRYEGQRSLDWFYQGWIDGTAIPSYELRQVKFIDQGSATLVSGVILQKDAPGDMVTSVPLYASGAGRPTLLGRIFADGPETAFHFSAPPGTRKVVVDPYETVLRRSH
jgi:hypothetical protein